MRWSPSDVVESVEDLLVVEVTDVFGDLCP